MDKKLTFRDWVAQHPKTSRGTLARRAMQDVPHLVLAIIAEEVDHCRRAEVAAIEARSVSALVSLCSAASATPLAGVGVEAREGFAAGLAAMFALGDGVKVSWGAATIEQHEQRVAMLRQLVNGTLETIARHEAAIASLRAAGAKCLDDMVRAAA